MLCYAHMCERACPYMYSCSKKCSQVLLCLWQYVYCWGVLQTRGILQGFWQSPGAHPQLAHLLRAGWLLLLTAQYLLLWPKRERGRGCFPQLPAPQATSCHPPSLNLGPQRPYTAPLPDSTWGKGLLGLEDGQGTPHVAGFFHQVGS